MISRRLFLSSSISLLGGSLAFAEAPITSLRPKVRNGSAAPVVVRGPKELVAGAKLSGQVAFAVADAKTGLKLESMNASSQVAPASVTKSITALYALNVLGHGHRFQTHLMMTGKLSNGVLNGDLILVGGADPTLDSNHLSAMAAQLKKTGIREVRGNFLVYNKALPYFSTIDVEQPDHVGYSPAVSGIALNFNRVHFEWRRSSGKYTTTMDARTKNIRPDVTSSKVRIQDRRLPVYKYSQKNGIDNWSVAKPALGNGGSRWLPVRNPALYAGDVLNTLLRSHGIRVKSAKVISKRPKGRILVTHQSEPLTEIVRDMLKFSTNLTAEMIGLAATQKIRQGQPQSLKASAREMNSWVKNALGISEINLVDHSGLGAKNRMSANAMVRCLTKVYANNTLRSLLKTIPQRDEKRRVIKNSSVKIVAKTGTLNFVSALAGYITTPDNSVLAFAYFSSDERIRSGLSKANREAPQGAKTYNIRSKKLQQRLISRWVSLYGK